MWGNPNQLVSAVCASYLEISILDVSKHRPCIKIAKRREQTNAATKIQQLGGYSQPLPGECQSSRLYTTKAT